MGKNWKGIWIREGNKIQSTCFSPRILIPILILDICLFIAHGQLQCIVIPILQHWAQHRNNIYPKKKYIGRSLSNPSFDLFFSYSLFNNKLPSSLLLIQLLYFSWVLEGLGTYNWSSGKISSKLKPIHL